MLVNGYKVSVVQDEYILENYNVTIVDNIVLCT